MVAMTAGRRLAAFRFSLSRAKPRALGVPDWDAGFDPELGTVSLFAVGETRVPPLTSG